MKLRPSPALVVAVLALVVAMTGTSYAAVKIAKNSVGSPQLKNNSVKSVDVKDGALSGNDVQDGGLAGIDVLNGSLTGADVADGGLTGADIADGALTSTELTKTCVSTQLLVAGVCIDRVTTGGMGSLATALADCDARQGRLMSYQEYKLLVTKPGITWADGSLSNYEVIDLQQVATNSTITSQAITFGGTLFGAGVDAGSNFYHRCVTYP